ncbi:MAG: RNA-binding protein [Actinobacteria bacterium]|nr:RNA-binding protein [Actinomycetota bacterium]MSX25064.1 RNA-binding protein [Actinomycetota bacterium]MSY46320.1 RNA-binding protein [Actinomycetota bacterium]MSY56897.1 RNA-binding protein [Actinomycetota bacterium]MTA99851.1 RNA-binding protein [Actinomycetota bacterium]
MMDEALEHLVKGIVDNPEDVVITEKTHRRGTTLEVRVNPEDIGKVIGRNGRTAKALRTVVSALAGRSVRVDLVETDEGR